MNSEQIGAHTNSVCFCKSKTELYYITATHGCSDDRAAVCALPEQLVPRKSGPILENYLKQREKSHLNVYNDLLKASKVINEEIDSKVRTLAELLLANIYDNQREIDCIVEKCTPAENHSAVDDQKHSMTRINTLLSARIQDLTNFKLEALALERERASKLKNVLQLHFQRIVAVGHKSPKTLLHEFDEKIYDVNQQLMSNARSYFLLEAKLRAQADESIIKARSELNQKIHMSMHRVHSAQVWRRGEHYLNNGHKINQSSYNSNQLGELKSQSKLVDQYSDVVLNTLTAVSYHFDDLHKKIDSENYIAQDCCTTKITKLQKIIEKAIYSLGLSSVSNDDMFHRDFIEIPRGDLLNMQKCLSNLGEILKNTYSVLHDAGHSCDAHMMRLAIAQKLTMASVEDLTVNHDSIELNNEVLTDIAIEQLRTAPDADKLQQYYDTILLALDRTNELYIQHSDAEVGKLEEFNNLISPLISTLLAEYNLFLEKNPRSPLPEINDSVNTLSLASPRNALTSSYLPISKEIFNIESHNLALCELRNGFLETFENNVPMISEQLYIQTQMWVDERRDVLHKRHSLKLMSHSIRKERIRAARDIRLAEIRYHEDRLNSHLDAIYDLVSNLPMEAAEFMSVDAPELYPLSQWLSCIHVDINNLFSRDPLDPEVKRLKMCSYASRLLKHKQLFSESLDLALEQYKMDVEHKIQVARISNFKLVSQLKLFSEEGKYAASEAMKASIALVKGADALEACFSRTMDCVNHRRSQLLSIADQQILPIQKLVDETLKSAPKGFLDKKKLGIGKK